MVKIHMDVDICIIGAGVAGLSAAKLLYEKGYSIYVAEAQEKVGGRIQTDWINGYLCDHGFQVILPSYPSAKRLLDYRSLNLGAYPRGAVIFSDQVEWFGPPLMYPRRWQFGKRLSPSFRDWICFIFEALDSPYPKQIDEQKTTYDYISERYSPTLVKKFLLPFFQGVFIDPNCLVSAQLFRYYWRLFALGGAAIPSQGMAEIPKQLASSIPNDLIKCSHPVTHLEGQRIFFENGKSLNANRIVLACNQRSLSRFIKEVGPPEKSRSVSTYFFSTSNLGSLGPLNFILNSEIPIQVVIPTLIHANYSQNGDHLCMVSCIGGHVFDPEGIIQNLKSQPHLGDQVQNWSYVHYHHVDDALPFPYEFSQQVSPHYFCGDWLSFGSIESAMRSGIEVANKIISES